jgi:fatty acid amide hydrolase
MKTIVCDEAFARDSDIVPIPFDQKEFQNNNKLRVGYYTYDGFLQCSPASVRAVETVVSELKAAGHYVAEFKPPSIPEGVNLYYALISGDNGKTISDQLKNDPWQNYTTQMMSSIRMPPLVKKVVCTLMDMFGDRRLANLLRNLRAKSTAEMWRLAADRKRFRQTFFSDWQDEKNNFDVVICPVCPLPSIPHDTYRDLAFAASYTFIYNLLDYPAGSIPVTRVKASDTWTGEPKGLLEKKMRSHYDANKAEGLPVGVQVVGLPFRDETVLRAMRIISRLVPFNDRPSSASLKASTA